MSWMTLTMVLMANASPILFVHGNGDSAALWLTTIWRFESNGYDPALLFAVDMPHPEARLDDGVPEENRSSTAEQARFLGSEVSRLLRRTGRDELILVGSSRGGNAIRAYVKLDGGHESVSLAVLCGTPNHGVFDSPDHLGSEWNARGAFLTRLNAGPFGEVHPGLRWATIRSDGSDKYAQPETGAGHDSPALQGAENVVIESLDHREVAFHPLAFREIHRLVAGRLPATLEISPESRPVLDGMISGEANGAPTNRPLQGASVELYEVDRETGSRRGEAVHRRKTGPDGRWGPFEARPSAYYEVVVAAEGYPVTHVYRSPFPRSSRYVHVRLASLPPELEGEVGIVTMSRPRGYFGRGRDTFTLDGAVPENVPEGVPSESTASKVVGEVGRSVSAVFGDERLALRSQPRGHWAIAEFHH